MGKKSLMIRMIDIVFILLFGFIAVSQIGSTITIDPPKSTEASDGVPQGAQIIIIGVKNDGTFPVEGGNLVLKNSHQLRGYLLQQMQKFKIEGEQLGVRIRADWDAAVEHGLTVAKICRELGINKGLDVVKLMSD